MKDVIIIGSGAGGGPLALALAQAGLEVLVLERGPRFSREEYLKHDEIDINGRHIFTPDVAEEPHTVVTPKTKQPLATSLGWIASCVGGGTVHMGSYLYRFAEGDFRMKSLYGEYEEIADWPYDYHELEPYYSRAEWEIGVSGQAGLNPFESHRSRPYPMPPLDGHPLTESFEKICREAGMHPFPTPRGINSRPYQGRTACMKCDLCGGHGCPIGARGSSQEALLPRAEQTGNCEVRAQSFVREILLGSGSRVKGCVYLDSSGREIEERARVICICCSAVESARLLLLSRSSRFPEGLANGSGLVGRYLQFHGHTMGYAKFPRDRFPELVPGERYSELGVSVMDHYYLPKGVSDIAKGGLLRFGSGVGNPLASAYFMTDHLNPTPWGKALKQTLRAVARDELMLYFEVFHDFLPNANTYVELDPIVRDKWSLPVARIHLNIPKHHRTAGRWLGERGLEVYERMGAGELGLQEIGSTSAYLVHGTCRAGHDPETSVLTPYCQAHEIENLFVVDGSFMPTSGGAPPTLTIFANSFRTADHIAARFSNGDFL